MTWPDAVVLVAALVCITAIVLAIVVLPAKKGAGQ